MQNSPQRSQIQESGEHFEDADKIQPQETAIEKDIMPEIPEPPKIKEKPKIKKSRAAKNKDAVEAKNNLFPDIVDAGEKEPDVV